MVRKREAAPQLTDEIPPAKILRLMSGLAPATIPGAWDLFVEQGAHVRRQGPDPCAAAWRDHGEALTAEAAGYGFRPHVMLADGETWRPDEAAAERRWREAFLTTHGRP